MIKGDYLSQCGSADTFCGGDLAICGYYLTSIAVGNGNNPLIVHCPADQWTVAARNITSATIREKITGPRYYQTYRTKGDTPPSSLAVGVMITNKNRKIESTVAIDLYIYAQTKTGSVRIDT